MKSRWRRTSTPIERASCSSRRITEIDRPRLRRSSWLIRSRHRTATMYSSLVPTAWGTPKIPTAPPVRLPPLLATTTRIWSKAKVAMPRYRPRKFGQRHRHGVPTGRTGRDDDQHDRDATNSVVGEVCCGISTDAEEAHTGKREHTGSQDDLETQGQDGVDRRRLEERDVGRVPDAHVRSAVTRLKIPPGLISSTAMMMANDTASVQVPDVVALTHVSPNARM